MSKTRKKQFVDENVFEAALERIRYCYKNHDKIIVNFSGGKDSTAVLNLCIMVARELGKLPVHAVFVDEEAIHPTTIEYVERVRHHPDVKLDWYCLPVQHRNACSNEQPYWTCWNPEEKHLWVRDLPAHAITEHPTFSLGMSFQEWMQTTHGPEHGKVCYLLGIRTEESLRRYRMVASKKNDSFITARAENKNSYRAFPIYDWDSSDVWKLVNKFNLDYNHTYDLLNKTVMHNKFLRQRVCPPFGEEPLRGLWIYAECFPDLWDKMINRVPGVATAWRYANTELYSNHAKPDNLTWKEYFHLLLENYEPEYKALIIKNVNGLIKRHYNCTDDDIKDDEPHPISGAHWKFFAKIAQKGDFKGRQNQVMQNEKEPVLKKLGITYEEALKQFGKRSK